MTRIRAEKFWIRIHPFNCFQHTKNQNHKNCARKPHKNLKSTVCGMQCLLMGYKHCMQVNVGTNITSQNIWSHSFEGISMVSIDPSSWRVCAVKNHLPRIGILDIHVKTESVKRRLASSLYESSNTKKPQRLMETKQSSPATLATTSNTKAPEKDRNRFLLLVHCMYA